jgi:hypothetical protein
MPYNIINVTMFYFCKHLINVRAYENLPWATVTEVFSKARETITKNEKKGKDKNEKETERAKNVTRKLYLVS